MTRRKRNTAIAAPSPKSFTPPNEVRHIARAITFASSSDASWHFPFERIEVFCHHRTIMTEEMERLHDSRGMDANFETVSFHMTEKEERWGYIQEDRAFIDAILNGTDPLVSADDGFKAVELVESVYSAIQTGERVRF